LNLIEITLQTGRQSAKSVSARRLRQGILVFIVGSKSNSATASEKMYQHGSRLIIHVHPA